MKKLNILGISLLCLVFIAPSHARDTQKTPENAARITHESGVVSAHPLATKAGREVLQMGGNAFDAAIATSAALGVVEPYGSGIGGGGFWLLYQADTDTYTVIDSRETAPLAAHKGMYLDENGEPIKNASRNGPLAAGIPGQPKAFVEISKNFGALSLENSLKPSIKLASEGFPVGERYISGVKTKKDTFNGVAKSVFLDNGEIPHIGWVLKQPDLAKTLTNIHTDNAKDFYEGKAAERMVNAVRIMGGIWTKQDLAHYQIKTRAPVIAHYKGAKIIMPPLPSSGGLVMKNIFNILAQYDLDAMPPADQKHIIVEAMRHAYHQRARYMGDTDFVDVPVEEITSPEKATAQKSMIKINQAMSSETLPMPAIDEMPKGTETTHFAVIDKYGNRVAVTQSINFWFGSGFMPPNTGVILNNEMDDFVIKPGVKNGYGLIGTSANAIEPGKRMLSSMTPTIIETKDSVLIIGTPGGSQIITINLLGILAYLDGKTPEDIVAMPRYHHQFIPDEIVYEKGALTDNEIKKLEEKGHALRQSKRDYGNMQIIHLDKKTGKVTAASDPRGQGAGEVY